MSNGNATTLFYLLYAKYGNNPIANRDVNQFKYKVFSIIFQYGPTWSKRIEIQEKLRALSEDDLIKGSKAIYNSAQNPSTKPSTSSLEELEYINAQNTTNYKKSKMDAYTQLWDLLATDVTSEFLNKFKNLFKMFVLNERPLVYVTETEEETEISMPPQYSTMLFTDVWGSVEDFLDDYQNCGIPTTISVDGEDENEDEGEG